MPAYIMTVNLTNADTGYQLSSLLSGILPADVSLHSVSYLRLEASAGWIVPTAGAYSATAGVPADHGGSIGSSGIVINPGAPIIHLDQVFLGSGVANHKVRVLAFR